MKLSFSSRTVYSSTYALHEILKNVGIYLVTILVYGLSTGISGFTMWVSVFSAMLNI